MRRSGTAGRGTILKDVQTRNKGKSPRFRVGIGRQIMSMEDGQDLEHTNKLMTETASS